MGMETGNPGRANQQPPAGNGGENTRNNEAPPPPPPPTAKEAGADPPGYMPTPADLRLESVYEDYCHDNDGTRLDGGTNDNEMWLRMHQRVAQLSPNHYHVPKGKVGNKFVNLFADELEGARLGKWVAERPMCFSTVILQTVPEVRSAKDIRERIWNRLKMWELGQYDALVEATEDDILCNVGNGSRKADMESMARAFNEKVMSGRLRQATRLFLEREGGKGVLAPDDVCTKTGRPVIDVLNEKHPELRDPAVDVEGGAFETYDATPSPVPLDCTEKTVEAVAVDLSGAAGPSGVDSVSARNMLLRFGKASEKLRKEIACWANWLGKESPSWALYRPLMACRLVGLDKRQALDRSESERSGVA